jgi:hypothetical protein
MKLGGCPPIIKIDSEIRKKREFKSLIEIDKKKDDIIDIKNILGIKI